MDELRSIGLDPHQQALLFRGQVSADHRCEVCRVDFDGPAAFWEHVASAHWPAKACGYLCEFCSHVAATRLSLDEHRKGLHLVDPNGDVCAEEFKEGASLQPHEESAPVVDVKAYPCDQCPKVFSTRAALTCHTAVHASVRKYECDLCSRRFKRKHHLQNHRYRHTGERPVQCPLCDKAFIQKASLNVHMKTHQRELTAAPITYRYLY